MRLKEFQIKQICQKIVLALRTKHLAHFTKSDSEVLARMEAIFMADLKVEDDLNREAEKLLEQYAKQMPDIDRQRMFQLIKKQLIKDRNLVI